MCCSTDHGNVVHDLAAEVYPWPEDSGRWCKCGGHPDVAPGDTDWPITCCGAITRDDGLCDRCRATCVPAAEVVEDQGAEVVDGQLVDAVVA